MVAVEIFFIENEVFRLYLLYSSVVLFKMIFLSFYTFHVRTKHGAFISEEDYCKDFPRDEMKALMKNEDVERVRRCHRNDLENILPFLVFGLLYSATNPSVFAATITFRTFTIARFLHSFAYLLPLPRPWRGVAFAAGFLVILYMGVQILFTVL